MVSLTTFSFNKGERSPFGTGTPDKLARVRISGSSICPISWLEGVLLLSQSIESLRALTATDGSSGSIGAGVPDKMARAIIDGSSNSSTSRILITLSSPRAPKAQPVRAQMFTNRRLNGVECLGEQPGIVSGVRPDAAKGTARCIVCPDQFGMRDSGPLWHSSWQLPHSDCSYRNSLTHDRSQRR